MKRKVFHQCLQTSAHDLDLRRFGDRVVYAKYLTLVWADRIAREIDQMGMDCPETAWFETVSSADRQYQAAKAASMNPADAGEILKVLKDAWEKI